MIQYLVIVVNFIIKNILTHCRALSIDLDVVRFGQVVKKSCYKVHFVFAIVLIFVTRCYGTFGLEYEAKGRIDWNELGSSPYTFLHQIYPRATWPQAEILIMCFEVATYMGWICLGINPPIEENCRIYPNVFNRKISKIELEEMLSFRRIVCRISYTFEIGTLVCAFSFLYIVLYLNQLYMVNLTAFLFWPLIIPYIAYFLLFAFGIIYYASQWIHLDLAKVFACKIGQPQSETSKFTVGS